MKKGKDSRKEGFFSKIYHDEKLMTHVVLVAAGIGGTVLFNMLPISTAIRTLLVLLSSVVAIESGMNFSKRWMELSGSAPDQRGKGGNAQ